jgi:hypothetical protein
MTRLRFSPKKSVMVFSAGTSEFCRIGSRYSSRRVNENSDTLQNTPQRTDHSTGDFYVIVRPQPRKRQRTAALF